MSNKTTNVLVIGGGVVGTAILRELSKYDVDAILVEKQPDLCEGSSKANSGIIHTGFDAPPGSVEAECLRRAQEEWPGAIENLKIPYIQCGAVMVATNEEEKDVIVNKYIPNAKQNGVEVQWIEKEELLASNPDVTSNAVGGLVVPGEAVADPFWATRAFAEIAVVNGNEVILNAGVTAIDKHEDSTFTVTLDNGTSIETDYIVNAAGLWSDEMARLVGDNSFKITPRKGQFILTEEPVNISQIILPVPTSKSKGTLVSPVVFGGFLLGPTAEDQEDKWDRSTTKEGLEFVRESCAKLVPSAATYPSIRQFAGVRAVCSEGDFVIRPAATAHHMVHAAGIRSTGLSASLGIAQLVAEELKKVGLTLIKRDSVVTELPELFDNADTNGEIICLCRSITKREIVDALKRPVPALTVDGVKRRTGAVLGECQGNCCIPKILDLIHDHTANQAEQPLKGLRDSYLGFKGEKQNAF